MTKLKTLAVGLVLAMATTAATPSMAANLIQNGGFVGDNQPLNGSFVTPGAGETFAGAWTVDTASIDWITGFWQSSDGDGYSVDLNGDQFAGGVKQTVATTIGSLYRLTFDLSKNPGSPVNPISMFVDITGVSQQAFSFGEENSLSDMMWTSKTFDFTAMSSSTTLVFRGNAAGTCCWGPALDNVALNTITAAVPEPATWAMMIGGFFGLGAALRQRRRVVA